MQERFTLQDAVRRNGQGAVWSQIDTVGSAPVELHAVATRPAAEAIDLEDLDDVELVDEDDYDFDLTELDAERLFWHQIGWSVFAFGAVFLFGVVVGLLISTTPEAAMDTVRLCIDAAFDIAATLITLQFDILSAVYEAIKPIFKL